MHVNHFDQQIKNFSWRVAVLQQRTQESPLQQQQLVAESLEELRTALEELQVAQEALGQQNEELVAGRQVVEAERQRYQDLFEFAPDGYLVTDASGTIWEANRAAADLLNVSSQQLLVGKPLALFIVESERLAFYSELTRLRGENQVQEWQVCLQPRHGAKIDAALTVVTVRDLQGKGVALRICVRDITARKRTEAALRESEERFRLMVEGVKDYAIFMLAPDGGVVSWNPGALSILGYQEAEIIGQYFSCFFTPEDIHSCKPEQELRMAVAEGRTEEEGWHVRKDGTRFWVSGVLTALRDEAVNLCGFSKIMRDMTERKQAETERKQLEAVLRQQAEELAQANRMKDEFLATLSHELRTPLNAILNWSQLLLTRKFNEPTTARALETIERNAKSLFQLVKELLDISRIIQGKIGLDVSPVNLVSVIQAAISTVNLAAQAKAIRIESVLDPTVGLVSGDANRLQQIVWNLFCNAVKFTPVGGRIEVRLERVNSQAQITVSDTGKGISADFLPYVFDRFRQFDSSLTRSYGGLGLGLASVSHWVELHGGTVRAESLGDGQGATFTVKLPLQEGSGDRF